ncbi:conserved hypothetical protein [Desulforapulum autotrophicum HRM2]|uniref:DUF4143 domain-containing protein n=2 Tax=Desulforapulum autotrophicum TaxID=2296 RepID=C0QGH0_DESAH|nr:conserved hypothetical protein [Desulforapulum autotrophicum HRM2]
MPQVRALNRIIMDIIDPGVNAGEIRREIPAAFIQNNLLEPELFKLAAAVDISNPTLKKYLAILKQTYMLRLLPPAEINQKKRLIKSPKIYLSDSGILHALLDKSHIGAGRIKELSVCGLIGIDCS